MTYTFEQLTNFEKQFTVIGFNQKNSSTSVDKASKKCSVGKRNINYENVSNSASFLDRLLVKNIST